MRERCACIHPQSPDFSGTWVAEAALPPTASAGTPPPPPRGNMWAAAGGSTITITHAANQLRHRTADLQLLDLQLPLKFVYRLDGSESRNTVMAGHATQTRVSHAAWDGQAVRIMRRSIRVLIDTGKPVLDRSDAAPVARRAGPADHRNASTWRARRPRHHHANRIHSGALNFAAAAFVRPRMRPRGSGRLFKSPGFFSNGSDHDRRRDWRQRGDFQRRQRRRPEASAVRGSRTIGRRVALGARTRYARVDEPGAGDLLHVSRQQGLRRHRHVGQHRRDRHRPRRAGAGGRCCSSPTARCRLSAFGRRWAARSHPRTTRPAAPRPVIVSHDYWRRALGGNAAAIGQSDGDRRPATRR